ncbi:MAG: hypothetical protein ACT4TC_16670 [Myxococcaceae bacterium]
MAVLIRNADMGRFTNPLHLVGELRALTPTQTRELSTQPQASVTHDALSALPQASVRRDELSVLPQASVTRVERDGALWLELRDVSGALLALLEADKLFALRDAALTALSVEANTRQATFVGEEAKPEHDLMTAWHIYQGAQGDEALEHVPS